MSGFESERPRKIAVATEILQRHIGQWKTSHAEQQGSFQVLARLSFGSLFLGLCLA
jgi:hypothetical protein